MIVSELQAFLQRFPPDAQVEIKSATGIAKIEGVQMAFDAAPTDLTPQNVSWADMVKEKIKAVLVASVTYPERSK